MKKWIAGLTVSVVILFLAGCGASGCDPDCRKQTESEPHGSYTSTVTDTGNGSGGTDPIGQRTDTASSGVSDVPDCCG